MKNLQLLMLFLFANSIFSQDADNHWQLGAFDVNFTTNPAVVSTITNSGNYGNASISDAAGNLLFYTDGSKIWNKNHLLMQNGDNIGNANSLVVFNNKQPAVIVPHPGNNNQYYVFSALIDGILSIPASEGVVYSYSIVDFGDVLYPLGKVIQISTLALEGGTLGA